MKTAEEKFKEELLKLMKKHGAFLQIEIEDDYAGVQSAKLTFDLKEGDEYISTGNELDIL